MNWSSVKLAEVTEILDKHRIPINNKDRQARLTGATKKYPYYGATGQVGEIDDYIFDGEAVLLGEDGAPFLEPHKPKAYMVSGQYWVNNHAHILRGNDAANNSFLCHQLNVLDYRAFVSGTTRLKLTQASLKELPVKLPPLKEQRRIVEKIETLFARLDQGEAELRQVQTLLARYRQSVLKAAVTGQLTADWRTENAHRLEPGQDLLARILKTRRETWQGRGQYKEPTAPDTTNLPELPDGWVWAPLEGLCKSDKHALKAGPFGSALKKSDYSETGHKIYGQEQVIAGDWSIGDYYIAEEKYLALQSCKVSARDILISLVGTIGKVLILPPEFTPGIINPRLVKISLQEHVFLPEFFKLYFESDFLKSLYKLDAHGATMDVLNLGIIKKLPYPLCSSEEQELIVERATQALESATQLEDLCKTELTRSIALRQSILKQAFAGRLVPQDPNDEPASELLARIRAQVDEKSAGRGKNQKRA